ncbi:MAG TPA: hypothetical protein VFG86_01320 [Chloroflexota bacterium]|nr:hypothetical protein [Chloroflexota bacterium]
MLSDNDTMSRVTEGMRVLDARGDEIGKVQFVRMGDPEAVTEMGNENRPTELIGKVAQAVLPEESEPDVPEPLQSRLRRTGYIKIDGPDLRDTDRYASSEHVREVSGDTVRLDVRKDQLAIEE